MIKYLILFLYLCLSTYGNSITFTFEQDAYLKQKKSITMCIDPDWAPFEVINANQENEGIASDIIRLVARNLGINIQLIPTLTWEESIKKSQNKECDILSLVNQTPKRDQWLVFTDPILEDPNVLVARSEHPFIEDVNVLNHKSIALLKDTAMIERFQNNFPKLKIIPVTTEEEAFWMVENKKADMTLRSLMVTAYTIKKENIFNLKIVGQPKDYMNILRIGVRKDEPILRDILNLGIRSISKQEREQIINKHVYIKIEPNSSNYRWLIYSILTLSLISLFILIWNYELRKRVEKEVEKNLKHSKILFQQSKQAALGALIANISHQWRESLTKISYANLTLRAHIIQEKKIPPELLDKNTQEIEQTLDFMSDTMQNFLEYYKPSTNIKEFEVHDSIKAVIRIIDTRIKNLNFDISFDIISNAYMRGIRNEWMQVWMNILSNSLAAAEKNIIIDPHMLISISNTSIQFSDNCGGIELKLLNNLNHEIYSGLGIKMCQDIVTKYGKTLDIYNTNDGALFTITLKEEQEESRSSQLK